MSAARAVRLPFSVRSNAVAVVSVPAAPSNGSAVRTPYIDWMAATSVGVSPVQTWYSAYMTEAEFDGSSPNPKEWLASWSATEYTSHWPGASPIPKWNWELNMRSPDHVPPLESNPTVSARSVLPAVVES